MSFFQSEIATFIKSIDKNLTLEKWGASLINRKLGFVFHEIKANQELNLMTSEFHVVHLWEDLWITRKEIVKSRIISLMGISERIFARKTKIIKLNKIELLNFLTNNHLSEPASGKHKYGLVVGNELVAVAAFSASCPIHRDDGISVSHQLVRFCTKNGVTVVGGLSKLITHFLKLHKMDDIMSYADLDWSVGNSYTQLGFEKIGKLAPQTFFVDAETMKRCYKLDEAADTSGLLQFTNQGSNKYLLNLKHGFNE